MKSKEESKSLEDAMNEYMIAFEHELVFGKSVLEITPKGTIRSFTYEELISLPHDK
tara:strand:- start:260 stop:427 length:168 start_codon:yes stop_codon:yes gene_type:complete